MSNLIYISNSILPSNSANSVHVMKMCNAFSKNGYNVTLLAKTDSREDDKNNIFSNYAVFEHFHLHLFRLKRFPLYSLFLSLLHFPIYIWGQREKKAIIYSRNRHSSFVLSFFSIAQIYELHGIAGGFLQRWMDGYICKSNKTERVVAISDALKNDMSDLMNIDKNKILVAHDGADLVDIENVCDVELLGSSNFNLGYVGSLLEGKGVDLICEAAKSLPNMGFHIVGGEGELLHEYKHKYEHIPNLYFYGYVQQKMVQGYLKVFDVVLLPNKKRVVTRNNEDIGKYTSPLKLFEYLAFDKKIIASKLKVFEEVVSSKEVLFFEPNSVSSLVESILVSHETEFEPGKKIKLIKDKYSWSIRADKVIKCFQSKC